MLFYLTDSLIVGSTDARKKAIHRAIRNLAVAADESKHQLLGDLEVLEWCKELLGNDPVNDLIRFLIDNFSTTSIPVAINEYTEVVLENPIERTEQQKRVYQVSYETFTQTDILQPAFLIGEDENDGDFYKHILKWYQWKIGNADPTNITRIGGGGTNTHRTFKTHVDHPYITCCITDTDKRYPDAPEGSTSAPCRLVSYSPPLSQLYVIDVHEAENLIPKDIIDALDWSSSQQNKRIFDGTFSALYNYDIDWLRYYDYKEGVVKAPNYHNIPEWRAYMKQCCHLNTELPTVTDSNFDTKINALKEKEQLCPALGRTLLKNTIAHLDSHTVSDHSFLPFQDNEWKSIGQLLLNFSICRNSEAMNY